MDARLTKLVNKLSDGLALLTVQFIEKEFNKKENLSFAMSTITSAHISSMFNLMRFCSQDEEAKETTEKFIKTILDAINDLNGVSHEIVTVDRSKK